MRRVAFYGNDSSSKAKIEIYPPKDLDKSGSSFTSLLQLCLLKVLFLGVVDALGLL